MMALYRIEFYDLRDVFHDVNIIAKSAPDALAVLRQYFPDIRVSVVFRLDVTHSSFADYREEQSLALNAYKYGIYPEIRNR